MLMDVENRISSSQSVLLLIAKLAHDFSEMLGLAVAVIEVLEREQYLKVQP